MDNIENNNVEKVEAEVTETPTVEEVPVVEEAPVINEVPAKNQSNALAILALVCGILGIIFNCCCGWLSIPFAIAALILALVAPKKDDGKMDGMALAGLILGIVGFVFFGFNIILTIIGASTGLLAELMEELF